MDNKEQIFRDLMEKMFAGTISSEERGLLYRLLSQSEEYKQQYKEMAKLNALLHISGLEQEKMAKSAALLRRLSKKQNYFLSFHWVRYAAAVLLLLTVSLGSFFIGENQGKKRDELYTETIVPLGSQTRMVLPDGTVAVLNSGSKLKYPTSFNGDMRKVFLEGEAYFEVAKNPEKVFRVSTGHLDVNVTGTVFNVNAYPEEPGIEVSLIEGGVDVVAINKKVHLTKDHRAYYNKTTGVLKAESCDAARDAMWTNGKLSFVSTSLMDILKDIERKYNVKIKVESSRVKSEIFSGTISLDMSLQEVFNFIDVDNKLSFEYHGNIVYVKDKKY